MRCRSGPGSFLLAAQVGLDVCRGLPCQQRCGMHGRPVGIVDLPVREWMMVALEDVMELYRGAVVAGNREAHGVGAVSDWESCTTLSGIPKVAERLEPCAIGLPRFARHGAADAFPNAAQRQPGIFRTGIATLGHYRVEVRAGHSAGMVAREGGHWFDDEPAQVWLRPRYSRDQWQAPDWTF